MSVQFYKFLHILGIVMVFMSYGGLIVRGILSSDNRGVKRMGAITSGIGMVLLLVAGFGLQAKLDYGWPLWIYLKLALWVAVGLLIMAINRCPQHAQKLWWVTLLVGLLAVFVATYRIGSHLEIE